MVLLFGFGPGEAKDLGEVAPVTCPNCHNNVFLHHLQSKKAVRLYFVPVVPYGTDEYLLCPICNRGLQLKDGQQAAVGAMQAATNAYRTGRMTADAYVAQTASFWRQLGVAPSGEQVLQSPAPDALPHTGGEDELAEKLESLDRLHRAGELTDDEFAAAKRHLLDR
jgi:zinc-ribbon family/Short C-terminal domain